MKKNKLLAAALSLAIGISTMIPISIVTAAAATANVTGITSKSSQTYIRTTWNKVSGAQGYILKIYNSNGTKVNSKTVVTPNLKYTFSGLKEGTTYKFSIQAVTSKNGKISSEKEIADTQVSSYIKKGSAVTTSKSTQKYKFLSVKNGTVVYKDNKLKTKSFTLNKDVTVTGLKDELNGVYRIQMSYYNFYVKDDSSRVKAISGSTAKILPTGAISQLRDVKDGYRNYYWCGCGPTSITMLVDWELSKGKARNTVISDAAKLRVAVLGSGYTFWNNKTGNCWGLSPRADGLDTLLRYEAGRKMAWQEVKKNQKDAVKQMKALLDNGHRMIAGVSPYGTWGHYLVVTGYYVKNNVTHFIVADPLYDRVLIRNNHNIADNMKNSSYAYYSVVDYTESQLYNIIDCARYCSSYRQYNATNLAYLWYIP